jgi:hypothetical protein
VKDVFSNRIVGYALGRLTPVEFELAFTRQGEAAA